MSFAIVRGPNGRRHEVDFGDDVVALDIAVSHQTVQITIEAIDDPVSRDRRRFATVAMPREQLMAALGAGLRRGGRAAGAAGPRLVLSVEDGSAG